MMNKASQQPYPRFITLEGGEGAGKTSLISFLKKQLESWGYSVLTTREPGGTKLGEQIRSLLLSHSGVQVCKKAELLLFLAARAQHIEEIIVPALSKNQIVICDRFNDSTISYQGAARGLGVEYVREMCQKTCGASVPDFTIYLDVDPKEGLARTRRMHKENASGGTVDRIEAERLEFHMTVRKAFLDLSKAESERFFVIDANQTQSKVFTEVEKFLRKKFSK